MPNSLAEISSGMSLHEDNFAYKNVRVHPSHTLCVSVSGFTGSIVFGGDVYPDPRGDGCLIFVPVSVFHLLTHSFVCVFISPHASVTSLHGS